MKDDEDWQLSQLLRTLAPPVRDPVFRIKVWERRERRRFIRRVALSLTGGVVAVVAYAIAATVGGTNPLARGLGLAVAGGVAAAMYLPALVKLIRGMGQ